MKQKIIKAGVVLAVFLAGYLGLYALGRYHFETTFYQLKSAKVTERIRIVELADLHNWTFGRDNQRLTGRIRELEPDIIVVAGDLVNGSDPDISTAVTLCEQLVAIAPVCYSFGNHENELVYGTDMTLEYLEQQAQKIGTDEYGTVDFDKFEMIDARLPDALRELGVIILNNNWTSLDVKGTRVDIGGVDNLSGTYFPYTYNMVEGQLDNGYDNLKLIIAHRPMIPFEGISCQEGLRYDLVMCGHIHGGIIRIPYLGGMFSSGGGWPWFAGRDAGMHETGQGNVVISRGLGNNNFLPRINNIPELVVVDFESE